MKEEIKPEVGMNKTGIMMSPLNSKESIQGADELTTPSEGDSSLIGANRIAFMKISDPVGTLPFPPSMKGLFSSTKAQLKTGNQSLLDKLGERIAFERTGTRLYEALLSKYMGTKKKDALPPLELLERFYHEELIHFYMVSDVMTELGGDPTAITPAADICAVAAQGWISVIADPRTNFTQSLEIILQAELVDNAGWELLINLADAAGLDEISQQFQKALEEENFHLLNVRQWISQLVLTGEVNVDAKTKH